MPQFTFEIARRSQSPVITETLSLFDDRGVWCHVEVLALQFASTHDAVIQVKDSEGRLVIRAGIRTALTSIEKCRCVLCPVKIRFDELFSETNGVEPDLLAILDRLAYGAFVISPGGEIAALNARAATVLGDVLTVRQGRLVASPPKRQVELERLLRTGRASPTSAAEAEIIVLPRSDGRRPLILQVTSLAKPLVPAHFLESPTAYLVIALDLEDSETSSNLTALSALGLTAAEARVAAQVGAGLTPQASADELGVSVATVRAHLKSIYLKIGVRRQADLVQLLAKLRGLA
jgi:DNA-binding CsgD family transcriptional regulator